MSNHRLIAAGAFLIIIACIALTAVVPEEKHGHLFIHLLIIPVIMLSVFLHLKDVVIITMFSCAGVWALGLLGLLENVYILIPETAVLIFAAFVVGMNRDVFKKERRRTADIINYKKEEKESVLAELGKLGAENAEIVSEIRELRRRFGE
ncbi:MAG TPA: hypothetical protein ENN55_02725 [Firmicutes bacterium]|nr:hypothetical protein [Bacillota bacterium]